MDRQKLLLIFGGAWLSAAVLSWFLYTTTTGAQQQKMKLVVAAARALPAGAKLKKGDLKRVSVAEKDSPGSTYANEKELIDRSLLYPVAPNEVVTMSKVASLAGTDGVPSIIPAGMRAVSVSVTDAASAAGLIQPRARVDVICSRTGSLSEAVSNVILQDVQIFSVGRLTELQTQAAATDQKGAAAQVSPSGQSRAVTLLVTKEEAAKLELAKNNGRISLALRNPSDDSRVDNPEPATGEVIDPLMGDRRSKMMQQARARAQFQPGRPLPGGIDLRDDRAWDRLIAGEGAPRPPRTVPPKKEEPPAKPKIVVDVYRGDKHVQEIFQ
jgi:pilus assembly protein CpaB